MIHDLDSTKEFLFCHGFDVRFVNELTEGQLLYIGIIIRLEYGEENTEKLQNFLNHIKTQGKEIFDLPPVKILSMLLIKYAADVVMSSISYFAGLRNPGGKTATFSVEEVLNILKNMHENFRTMDCSFFSSEWFVKYIGALKSGDFLAAYIDFLGNEICENKKLFEIFCGSFVIDAERALDDAVWGIAFLGIRGIPIQQSFFFLPEIIQLCNLERQRSSDKSLFWGKMEYLFVLASAIDFKMKAPSFGDDPHLLVRYEYKSCLFKRLLFETSVRAPRETRGHWRPTLDTIAEEQPEDEGKNKESVTI